jgi:quercetin dioxygenase-like cupin family protein
MQSAVAYETFYAQWLRDEGLDVVDASAPIDLGAIDVRPWARRGGRGVFLRTAELPATTDCYVCEIPAGRSLAPRHHLFEEIILVLAGRGSTTFGNGRGFEWKAGTLFALPLNTTYRHFNGSGKESARFVAVTTAPAIINAFQDLDFVFDCGHAFGSRLLMSDAAGPRTIDIDGACGLDALDCPLASNPRRGVGGHLHSNMGTRNLSMSITQLPPATYGKAHAHAQVAYAVVLAGEGYSLAWPEGGERTCLGWRQGALFASPGGWLRQHFNPDRSPARTVTLMASAALQPRTDGTLHPRGNQALMEACIDYGDEAADVRAAFAVALAERGLGSRMEEAYAREARGE